MLRRIRNNPLTRFIERWSFWLTIRPSDVFIVAYPRSGTTWMRFLLANLLNPGKREEINLTNFGNYIPDINLKFNKRPLWMYRYIPNPRFFSIHIQYHPRLPKVVYIVRDPRDVLVSYFHFKRVSNPDFNLCLRDFVSSFMLDEHQYRGQWDVHVMGWFTAAERIPSRILLIRYEDMQQDTGLILKKVVDFAGLKYSKNQIQEAVEASTFERMTRIEERHGIDNPQVANGRKDERVIRRGKVGAWREELLDGTCVSMTESKYGEVMKLFGYL